MIKVLEYFGEPLWYGGEEMFMFNMYKNFESPKISYAIGTAFTLTNKNLIELSQKRNETIYHFDYDTNSSQRRKYAKNCLKQILQKEKFDVVHIHSSSLFILFGCAKVAKKMGVKKVIVHSHIAANESLKHLIFKKLFTNRGFKKYADLFFACSHLAAKFQFSDEIIKNKAYMVINNGIEIEKFVFDEKVRKEYKSELGLNDCFSLLNVGRFAKVKNQQFIVQIAKKLKEKLNNFKIILIGDGDTKEEIVSQVKENGLENNFVFLEKRNDVPSIMMASDMFILPSLFEGFPVTAIESQAAGLKTICSNTITTEASITDLYNILPIEDADVWVNKILELKDQIVERKKYAKIVSDAGYSAKESALILEKTYLGE